MTAGSETLVVAEWLTTTFQGDGPLVAAAVGGVWDGPASEGTVYPILRFDPQGPPVVLRAQGSTEVWVNSLWKIVGVCEGSSYTSLRVIAERVRALIHGVEPVVLSDGMIHACVRENPFQGEYVQDGRQYRQLGGIYRIYVSG